MQAVKDPSNPIPSFTSDYQAILDRIDPIAYGKTRNYVDGSVSYLSPYISRGVISTRMVLDRILAKGYKPYEIEKFIQELAWRDYWQQVWIEKEGAINQDLRHPQQNVSNREIAAAIVDGSTGIEAIDQAIAAFYKTGYLHNHLRMYIAFLACNVANSHWRVPAQWMYYHLLDADWASNALSWQWVAGANSNKKYIANQENINTYCHTDQHHTFLDISYEALGQIKTPDILKEVLIPNLKTPLPETELLDIQTERPTFLYNFYNLDPNWEQHKQANRILLLEPSIFTQYPISQKTVDFVLALGRKIEGLQIFVGEFDELVRQYNLGEIYFKEHPLNRHYTGTQIERDWIFGLKGYFRSFFAFWKRCKKEMKAW